MQSTTYQLKMPYRACIGVRSLLFNTFIKLKCKLIDKITLTWSNGIIKFLHNVMIGLVKLINIVQVIYKTNRQRLYPGLKLFIKFTHKSIITETTGC